MRQMSPEEEKTAAELFASAPDDEFRRLVVRFNPSTLDLYKAVGNRTKLKGATLLRFDEKPDVTPTGGHYIRRSLTVRTRDGRKWYGTVKNGTDTVRLRLAPTEHETD